MWSLGDTTALLEEARALRPELEAHLVLTRVQPRTAVGAGARAAVEGTGLPVAEVRLGFRVAYQESLVCGRGVTTHEPLGAAAREIRRLYDELFGRRPRARGGRRG